MKLKLPELTDSPPDITELNENWQMIEHEFDDENGRREAHEADQSNPHRVGGDQLLAGESGTVSLTNSRPYPFNNSQITVPLAKERINTTYEVKVCLVSSTGHVKHIHVTDKQVNGFKLSFTGSATAATIRYELQGGLMQ